MTTISGIVLAFAVGWGIVKGCAKLGEMADDSAHLRRHKGHDIEEVTEEEPF